MRRKHLAIGVATVAALAATACSSAASDENDVLTLRLSHFMEPTHPHEVCGFKKMNEELEDDGMKVETYPAAQLGGESQSLELVNTNNLDMSSNGPSFLGVYDPSFNVLDAAYLFDSAETQHELSTSGGTDELLDQFHEETGMKVFRGWYYGTRHMTANEPILNSDQLRGLKLRAPDAPLYRINIAAMGGSVTPMALNEVYMGLQQGVVDAQENPLPTIETMNLDEVQSDLSLTGHMVQTLHISVAEEVWDSLSREQQENLEEAINLGGEAAYECVVREEERILEEFRSDGSMQISEVSKEAFQEPVRAALAEGYEFSDEYRKILRLQQ